jgi:hypothetical protein
MDNTVCSMINLPEALRAALIAIVEKTPGADFDGEIVKAITQYVGGAANA